MSKIEQIRRSETAKPVKPVKAARKATHTSELPPATVHSAQSELDLAYSEYNRAQARLLHAVGTSWQRIALSYIAALLTGAGIACILGVVTEIVIVSIFTLSGSATAAVIVWALSVALALYLAARIAPLVATAVYDGTIERFVAAQYAAAKGCISALLQHQDIELGERHA